MLNRLRTATIEDAAAKRAALAAGVVATRPLTAERLAQLCSLGEQMMLTEARKLDAERDVCDATIHIARPVPVR